MEKDEKVGRKLSLKAEEKLNEILAERRITVLGWRTIEQLNKELGLPIAVIEMAKVEARTGMTGKPFIKVSRFVDGKLEYRPDLVIKGLNETVVKQLPYSGIQVRKVRHPKYDGGSMPKATKKEIFQDSVTNSEV